MKYSTMGKVGQGYWSKMPKLQQTLEENLNQALLGTLEGHFGFIFVSDRYAGCMYMDYKLVDDTHIKLRGNGKGDDNGRWNIKNGKFNNYVAPFGWLKYKTFKIKGNSLKNPTELILTDVKNPDNVIHLYSSKIVDPLNN